MAVGPRPYPEHRPSCRDSPAPSGRPGRLAREMWTRPISAPPMNPDIAQSARPAAVAVRDSVAYKAEPTLPGLEVVAVHPEKLVALAARLVEQTGFVAQRPAVKRHTK